jgi:D-cysteine desulfhydrase family pyridoxal phosphate-dependent enzyme
MLVYHHCIVSFGERIANMTPQELKQRLGRFPRLALARTPTPLTYLPRLSATMGRPIFIKRDDDMGPGLGGNKTRKLGYLMGEAVERGLRKVVTFGGLQSNHARLTAAAANKAGLEAHLFYFDKRPSRLQGNLLINTLLGAKMHFVPLGGGSDGSMTLETTIRLVRLLAWLRVGSNYFIPVGGHSWLGCLGYVEAAVEIHDQAAALGLAGGRLVTAAGTGGTLAGLWAGLTLLNSPVRPLGIDVGKLWKGFPASIAGLAAEIRRQLGEPGTFLKGEVPLVENRYVGDRYGVPSRAGDEALRLLAQTEGILLDPVYTAKAFAGLLDLAEKGELGQDEPLIFLHTGGIPALFAFT